jgi:hypothetical protein
MKDDTKEKIKIGLDIILGLISLITLGMFYSSVKYRIYDVMDWLSNLEWYWYGLIFFITILHPIFHLLKYLRKEVK